jgi:hypothetical protein
MADPAGKKVRRIMDVADTLPSLEDAALAILHANADRLERNGTPAQKAAAAALMPTIIAELVARREARQVAAREAAALRPKRAAKRKVSSAE